MKQGKTKALICGLAFAGTICLSTVQAYTQYPPEGGQWNYGVGVLGSYSDYINPTRDHGSTVNYNGKR